MARKKDDKEMADRIPVKAHSRPRPPKPMPPQPSDFGLAQAPGGGNMPEPDDNAGM